MQGRRRFPPGPRTVEGVVGSLWPTPCRRRAGRGSRWSASLPSSRLQWPVAAASGGAAGAVARRHLHMRRRRGSGRALPATLTFSAECSISTVISRKAWAGHKASAKGLVQRGSTGGTGWGAGCCRCCAAMQKGKLRLQGAAAGPPGGGWWAQPVAISQRRGAPAPPTTCRRPIQATSCLAAQPRR